MSVLIKPNNPIEISIWTAKMQEYLRKSCIRKWEGRRGGEGENQLALLDIKTYYEFIVIETVCC